MEGMEHCMKKTMKIDGMMCQHCAKSVKKALEGVPGVSGAQVSLEEKTARVDCGEEVSDDSLCSAVTEAGYTVTAFG